MEKSFNTWRGPLTEDSHSEDESDDVVEDSTHDPPFITPDSDPEESLSTNKISKSYEAVEIAESTDEELTNSFTNCSSTSKRISNEKQINTSSFVNSSGIKNSSSPICPPSTQKKNKKAYIIDSDSDDSDLDNKSKPYQITESSCEEDNSNVDSSSLQSSSKQEGSVTKSFQSDSICSSTKFIEDDITVNESTSKSKSKFNEMQNISLKTDKQSTLPVVDLTVMEENNDSRYVEGKENTTDSNKVIVIDSDSDNVACDAKLDLTKRLTSMKITPVGDINRTTLQKKNSNLLAGKENENDYFSRVESLKAEEIKLKKQVSELLQDIETTKRTLHTANISALPDKGVRLQMFLKNQESKLRDLRYQQGTLSNEILKLQLGSNKLSQPPIKTNMKQGTNQKIFKLPTMATDLNALGKKAMETHRTQQALTVDSLRVLHNSLKTRPDENCSVEDPKGLNVQLMPHQKHALAWMLWREKEKPSGGILADDMGLGKTLTLISLIMKTNEEKESQKEEEKSDDSEDESDTENNTEWLSTKRPTLIRGKTLVVCPATLLGQWEGEIKSKVKRGVLDALVHHGSNREKKARRLARPDVVITTYNIVSRDGSQTSDQSPLFQIRWERVILDEAHQIRNYKTQTAKSVFLLKSRSRWALSGTPVHNKEIDLFALMKFLRCSPFDDLNVWKRWVDNRDAAGMQRLNTITQSLMLRRTKQGLQEKGELKSLLNKKFHTIFVSLNEEEQTAYENLLNFSKSLFAEFLAQKALKENALGGIPVATDPKHYLKNSENPFENHPHLARLHKQMVEQSDVKSHHILLLLLRLRQFCCHPALVKSMLHKEDMSSSGIEGNDGLDLDMMDKLTRMSLAPTEDKERDVDSEVTVLSSESSLYSDNRLNSKLMRVMEVVEEIVLKSEDKLILVSQWVTLLDVLGCVLKARKIKYVSITGNVPVKDRAEIVEKFNRKGHNPRVMLLSLTAGGVGLNLVGGNHLLLLDLHWNPQLENQACDRIYRVGQEKNVHIYKFIASETIEERILRLQEKKLEIADNIVNHKQGAHSSKLTMDDLKMLFQLS